MMHRGSSYAAYLAKNIKFAVTLVLNYPKDFYLLTICIQFVINLSVRRRNNCLLWDT